MSAQYTCPECGTGFNDRTAYCEDWRNNDKKFGCPNCHTFFNVGVSKIKNKKKPAAISLILTVLTTLALYTFNAPLWSYIFVLFIGFQSYDLAGKFFEGNPKMVLTPISKCENNT